MNPNGDLSNHNNNNNNSSSSQQPLNLDDLLGPSPSIAQNNNNNNNNSNSNVHVGSPVSVASNNNNNEQNVSQTQTSAAFNQFQPQVIDLTNIHFQSHDDKNNNSSNNNNDNNSSGFGSAINSHHRRRRRTGQGDHNNGQSSNTEHLFEFATDNNNNNNREEEEEYGNENKEAQGLREHRGGENTRTPLLARGGGRREWQNNNERAARNEIGENDGGEGGEREEEDEDEEAEEVFISASSNHIDAELNHIPVSELLAGILTRARATPLLELCWVLFCVLLLLGGNALQVIALNFWVRSFPSMASGESSSAGNYVVFVVSSFNFAMMFGVVLLVYLIRNGALSLTRLSRCFGGGSSRNGNVNDINAASPADNRYAVDFRENNDNEGDEHEEYRKGPPALSFWLRRESVHLLLFIAAMDAFNSLLTNFAVSYTYATLQTLVTAVAPIFAAVFSKLLLNDRRRYVGQRLITISFTCIVCGVLIAALPTLLESAEAEGEGGENDSGGKNASSYYYSYFDSPSSSVRTADEAVLTAKNRSLAVVGEAIGRRRRLARRSSFVGGNGINFKEEEAEVEAEEGKVVMRVSAPPTQKRHLFFFHSPHEKVGAFFFSAKRFFRYTDERSYDSRPKAARLFHRLGLRSGACGEEGGIDGRTRKKDYMGTSDEDANNNTMTIHNENSTATSIRTDYNQNSSDKKENSASVDAPRATVSRAEKMVWSLLFLLSVPLMVLMNVGQTRYMLQFTEESDFNRFVESRTGKRVLSHAEWNRRRHRRRGGGGGRNGQGGDNTYGASGNNNSYYNDDVVDEDNEGGRFNYVSDQVDVEGDEANFANFTNGGGVATSVFASASSTLSGWARAAASRVRGVFNGGNRGNGSSGVGVDDYNINRPGYNPFDLREDDEEEDILFHNSGMIREGQGAGGHASSSSYADADPHGDAGHTLSPLASPPGDQQQQQQQHRSRRRLQRRQQQQQHRSGEKGEEGGNGNGGGGGGSSFYEEEGEEANDMAEKRAVPESRRRGDFLHDANEPRGSENNRHVAEEYLSATAAAAAAQTRTPTPAANNNSTISRHNNNNNNSNSRNAPAIICLPPQSDDTTVKLVMLFSGTSLQALLSLALFPINIMPLFGSFDTLSDAGRHLLSSLHCLFVTCEHNLSFCLLFSVGFCSVYAGAVYLNQHSVTLCAMVAQLAGPLTALLLLTFPFLDASTTGDAAPPPLVWAGTLAAVAVLVAGTVAFLAWDEATAPEKERDERRLRARLLLPPREAVLVGG